MKRALWLLAAALLLTLTAAIVAGAYLGYFASDPVKMLVPPKAAGAARQDVAVVMLSGDMGFNVGMGPAIAARFNADRIPVMGFNSLTYFRGERTPQEVERMVRGLIVRARREFGEAKLVFVGQSFGADALELGLAGLDPSARGQIAFISLIVPTDSIYLRASPNEMLNLSPADIPALPSARQLDWLPVVCIHGAEEPHSLCPLMTQPNVRKVTLPGGHFLNRDSGAVYAAVREGMAEGRQ